MFFTAIRISFDRFTLSKIVLINRILTKVDDFLQYLSILNLQMKSIECRLLWLSICSIRFFSMFVDVKLSIHRIWSFQHRVIHFCSVDRCTKKSSEEKKSNKIVKWMKRENLRSNCDGQVCHLYVLISLSFSLYMRRASSCVHYQGVYTCNKHQLTTTAFFFCRGQFHSCAHIIITSTKFSSQSFCQLTFSMADLEFSNASKHAPRFAIGHHSCVLSLFVDKLIAELPRICSITDGGGRLNRK